MINLSIEPLSSEEREAFILMNQEAFLYSALAWGECAVDEDGEVISRATIEACLDDPKVDTYRIVVDGEMVGGVAVKINSETQHNELDLLFISRLVQGKGLGQRVWQWIEARYPETKQWETHTPYFDKRNIHFYVNCCGFSIVEFFCKYHTYQGEHSGDGPDEMFRFIKKM